MEIVKDDKWRKELKERADELVGKIDRKLEDNSEDKYKQVLNDLQVYQIELELQNDELRQTQKHLEEAKNYYSTLFDKAPIGYLVLDEQGIIQQVNATALQFLGREHIKLRGLAFADLISKEDANVFRARYRSIFKNPSNKTMALKVKPNAGSTKYLQLEALRYDFDTGENDIGKNSLLVSITDVSDIKQNETELRTTLDRIQEREREVTYLLEGARSVLEHIDFAVAARKIFDTCGKLIGSTSGYVAMLNEMMNENELLFLESGGMPCSVNKDLPMPIRGLREEAYKSKEAVFINDFMHSKYVSYLPKGHVNLKNVLFAPLVLDGKALGVIGLANKPEGFDENDARLAMGFGELAAIALRNSKNVERRNQAEKMREKVILDLQKALSEVKRLSGMLPICSGCKKVRDDKGYWKQIEAYLAEHSDATFTHGLCPECINKYYPEIANEEIGNSVIED